MALKLLISPFSRSFWTGSVSDKFYKNKNLLKAVIITSTGL
jgi:hypothetical protein